MLLSRVRFQVSVLLARAAILATVLWGGGGLWKLNWGSGSRVREFGCSFASDVIISIALLKSSPMFECLVSGFGPQFPEPAPAKSLIHVASARELGMETGTKA